MGQYFIGGNSSKVTTKKASEATTVPATGLGPSRLHRKKRIASGDVHQKSSKTQIVPSKDPNEHANKRSNQLEGTEVDRLILEDQSTIKAQLEEENQGGDRLRAAAAPSQLTPTSGISEETRAMIVRNKEEAIKKKKAREEGVQVESEIHKKQKSKPSENLKKRNSEASEEEEETSPSKKQKLNGQKRNIMEVEDSEQENSSKRKKSAGQDGIKQLDKGIS